MQYQNQERRVVSQEAYDIFSAAAAHLPAELWEATK
jgi:hypothetical protein